MHKLIYLRRFILPTCFSFIILSKMLGSISPSAQAAPPLPLPHPKSQAGVMGPVYGMAAADRVASMSASTLFAPYTLHRTGSWPEAVVAGEWMGDGRTDAALSTSFDFDPSDDQQVHLFAQTAAGALTRTHQITVGVEPVALARGDLGRDGVHDLVVVNKGEHTLGLLIQSTPGTFSEMITYTTDLDPDAVAVGDFNTDLYDDIAVAHAVSQTVAIYYQQADGTLAAPIHLPVGSDGFNDLDVGDLDHDGRDDLVLLRGAALADQVVIVYQRDGVLSDTLALTAEAGGYVPHGLAVGDVTGDGRDDVVITAGGNTPNAFVNVFPQQPDGTMAVTPTVYPAYHIPEAVEIGDVNHDGRNDVLIVHAAWASLSIYLQNDTGTLDAYVSDPLPYDDFYRPGALDLADVSGDGALDVLVATHGAVPEQTGLAVLTNTTGTAPTSTITTPALGDIISDQDTAYYLIEGLVSTDAVTLEISTDGGLTWQPQPAETSWSYNWSIPAGDGVYVILARTIDAAGRIQSPPARTRIIVARQTSVYLPLILNDY
jgi:hypothetical protein